MLFFLGVKLKKNAFKRQLRYFMVVSGIHSSVVFNACAYVCMYVCIFIKLHITAQSGPVIRVILCHSH